MLRFPAVLRSSLAPLVKPVARVGARMLSSPAAPAGGLWGKYLKLLETNPFVTKVTTSVFIIGAGDVMCQLVVEGDNGKPFDFTRLSHMMIIGGVLIGPCLHVWYGTLGRFFPGNGWSDVAKRLACDQLLFAPPFVAAFFAALATLQGKPEETWKRLEESWVDSMITNYKLWPAAQIINFRFVPLQLQVLFSNGVALIWNTYLSWEANRHSAAGAPDAETPALEK